MRLRLSALAVGAYVAAAAGAMDARAGAWTQPAGQGQIVLGGTFTRADRLFDASGRLVPTADYRKFELPAHLEYGATDWLTLIAAPALLAISTGQPATDDYSGIGHSEAGARARLWQGGRSVASLQGTLRLPGASDPRAPAQAGQTDVQADLRLLAGHGFSLGRGWTGFVNGEIGYRFRDGPPDEYRLDVTLGLRPTPRWLLLAQSFNTLAARGGRAGPGRGSASKLQLSVVRDLTVRWAVQLGTIATIAGEDALVEYGVVAAIWYRF